MLLEDKQHKYKKTSGGLFFYSITSKFIYKTYFGEKILKHIVGNGLDSD